MKELLHPIKIGTSNTGTNIFLAPLAGCADLPFRLMMREYGARFCFFEMLDANSITHKRAKSLDILKTDKRDTPVAAQVLGTDPGAMLEASLKIIEEAPATLFIDINSACPVKKVIKKKAGVYLLKTPDVLLKIIKSLSRGLKIPVTVKMRIGYEKKDCAAIAGLARDCEQAGASAIFAHGRTGKQSYEGAVDYESIRAIKDAISIPVIGGGNILTPELAKKMLIETGCDGIFIARGAFGNPWIFKDIESYISKGILPGLRGASEKKKALKRHLEYIAENKELPRLTLIGIMRKTALWYLKGFPQAARLRALIGAAKDQKTLFSLIDSA